MDRLKSGARKLGLNLDAGQLQKFEIYYQRLVEWKKRVNLTSVTGYEEVQIRHFLDSLTVVKGLPAQRNGWRLSIIDVGTGAGFPGIPLRLVVPGLRLVLLEATARKAEFLQHLTDELELDDVEIVGGRAEEVAHERLYRETFDVAVSRALAPLNVLAELTLPFCRIDGRLIAPKKGNISREVDRASEAVKTLGGEIAGVLDIELDEFDDERRLVIIDKVKITPPKYPRRPGIPGKRPIL